MSVKKVGGAVLLGERDPGQEAEDRARAAREASEAQLQAILKSVAGMSQEEKIEWLLGNVIDLARQVNGILAVLPGIGAGLDALFTWRSHMEEFEGRVTGQLLLGGKRGN